MIRAIVWKELREQGLIAVVLAVLGSALLVVAAMLAEPPSPSASPTDVVAVLGAGRMLTLMLVVTAGMVCGGALFAAEKEAGTMSFLEALPAGRLALWRAKLVAGLVLAALEVVVLLGVAGVLRLADGPFMARLVVYALLAFAWGTLGSTLARTTLGSVGIAIPAASLAMFVFLIPIMLLFSTTGTGMPRQTGWLLFEFLMLVTPLTLSAWRFTALDRLRTAETVDQTALETSTASAKQTRPAGLGIRALVWLTLRQLRFAGVVLSMFALAFGLAMLLPDLRPVFLWPFLTLAAGVLAGVIAFGDEQSHRTALFWGEFRLPIGRAWWVKIGLHLVLLTWLLFLMILPCVIRSQILSQNRFTYGQTFLATVFQSRLFDELGSQGWKYVFLPALYGFAFGHLCGLLFRKLVVAYGVAMMLGGVGAVAWMPSLLAGGVRHWQVWLPVVAVLLTGRFLMRSWATDRAHARSSILRLVGGMCTVVVVLAAGLVYRIVQIPVEPDNADDVEFVEALPNYDANKGGREFRTATERFARVATVIPEVIPPGDTTRRVRVEERLEAAVRGMAVAPGPGGRLDWPREDLPLNNWLDALYNQAPETTDDKTWHAYAADAAAKPIGVYDHPKMVTTMANTALAMENARRMAAAILGHGLLRQSQGDPSHFVPALRTVLCLARTIRYGGGAAAFEASIEIEKLALQAADRWLERLPAGYDDQTRALTRVMLEADETAPFDPHPYILADRSVIRGMMQAPSQWLPQSLNTHAGLAEQTAAEADLVAIAWTVWWERERTRRLVGMANESLRPDSKGLLVGRPGSPILQGRSRAIGEMSDRDVQLRTTRRSVLLKSAIRTYRSEHGTVPATQAELVSSGYLSELPLDPFADNKPFGYRVVSKEETLVGPPRMSPPNRPLDELPSLKVAAGQVIIWSVGYDRIDQGGKVAPGGWRAEDLVYVVPNPAVVPK